MYVRCQKLKGKDRIAVMICHSERNGTKVTQRTLKYFGIAHNNQELLALKKIAAIELQRIKSSPPAIAQVSHKVEQIKEEIRIIEGFHEIFGVMYDRLNLSTLLSGLKYRRLRDVAIARIAAPSSKCRTAQMLTKLYAKPLSEDQIYYLMDCIIPHEAAIKAKIFEATRQLSSQQKIDLLFFDVTTLHFESQKRDDLRDFEYSKDHKIGETQVVLALATTSEGLPIGYSLFSGKTAEVKTLLKCLDEWRQFVDISEVIVIADRAMMSEENLQEMERNNIRYVVAAKLKSYSKNFKEQILKRHEERIVEVGEEHLFAQEHAVQERRLIVSYSESRALKDREDRARLLIRLQKKIPSEADPRKLVTNRGYLKFIDEKAKGKVVINEEKIAQESRWDGLHGVITNDKTSSIKELLGRYRQLWIIEESFRINKSTLAMRPIFHFKERRIEAHILICYLAFALSRYVQHQLKTFGIPLSIDKIRDELFQVEASIINIAGQTYRMPSKLNKTGDDIYRAMGISRSLSTIKVSKKSKCSEKKKTQVIVA
jgi:transposase